MLKIVIFFAVVGLGALLYFRRSREWLLEEVKAASDAVMVFLLRATSQFGSELTEDGMAEQRMWREQRLRNLHGLALRSKQAISRQQSAVSTEKSREVS